MKLQAAGIGICNSLLENRCYNMEYIAMETKTLRHEFDACESCSADL